MANPPNLSPEMMAYFRSLTAPTQYGDSGGSQTRDGLMPAWDISWAASPETGEGPSGTGRMNSIVGPGRNPMEHAEYNPETGEFQRYYTVKDKFMGMDPMLAFALAAGGMALLPTALGGAGAAGAGAAEAGGGLLSGAESTGTLLGGAGSDAAGAGLFNAAADSQLANLALADPLSGYLAAGATPAAVNLGAATGNALGMNTISSGSWLSDLIGEGAASALTKYAPNLVGAALGAASSKDQTQTSTKAPWEAVQPWMKENITKGQDLQKQYEANPFNETQKNALQQLLDVSNSGTQALPGLLNFANTLGQSNYQRSGGRNLAYSAPRTAAPAGVGFGVSKAPAIDWLSMPTVRKA